MHLNIKNDRAHLLAAELARKTGENMTVAVTPALEERLERLSDSGSRKGFAERWLRFGRENAHRWKEPWKSMEHGDLLYDDEFGLPRK